MTVPDESNPNQPEQRMTPMRFPGLLYTLAAIACVIAWVNSDSPDRIALMFAAVMFVVNAAASRVIAELKGRAA